MKFLRKLFEPSYSRQADFHSLDATPANYKFNCADCSNAILFPFTEAITECWRWEEEFDDQTLSAIKMYFDMNIVGKSPDGGWPSVFEVSCNACQSRYLIYSSVKETSNSVFYVTVQSIAEISPTE